MLIYFRATHCELWVCVCDWMMTLEFGPSPWPVVISRWRQATTAHNQIIISRTIILHRLPCDDHDNVHVRNTVLHTHTHTQQRALVVARTEHTNDSFSRFYFRVCIAVKQSEDEINIFTRPNKAAINKSSVGGGHRRWAADRQLIHWFGMVDATQRAIHHTNTHITHMCSKWFWTEDNLKIRIFRKKSRVTTTTTLYTWLGR